MAGSGQDGNDDLEGATAMPRIQCMPSTHLMPDRDCPQDVNDDSEDAKAMPTGPRMQFAPSTNFGPDRGCAQEAFKWSEVVEDAVQIQDRPVAEAWLPSQKSMNGNPSKDMRVSMTGAGSNFMRRSGVHDRAAGEGPRIHNKVMVDAKGMKEQLKLNLHKERYDVTNFYKMEGIFQFVARNDIFENVTLGVIAINALWISIDTDLNTSDVLAEAEPRFIVAENFFCFYFASEISIRFGAFLHKRNCLRDAWFVFDSVLVAMMIFETWLMTIVYFAAGGGGGGVSLGSAGMIKMLRLLRLSRMARMARLLRSMPEIVILIKGMLAAFRSVMFTLLLLIIILYIFGVIFRQLADGTATGEEYFATVPRSMNKLMIYGIFFDSFGMLVDSIIEEDLAPVLLFLFYMFVLLASCTVMNMLIGVLCEVVSAVAEAEHEELTMNYLRDSLWVMVQNKQKELAQDDKSRRVGRNLTNQKSMTGQKTMAEIPKTEGETFITKAFFKKLMGEKSTAVLLKEVEVEVVALVDLVDTIFSTDTGEEKDLSFPEFVEVMLEHRSNSKATIKDITNLRRYVRTRIDSMDADVSARIRRMQAHMNGMSTLIEKMAGADAGTVRREAMEDLKKLEKAHERKSKSKAKTGSTKACVAEPDDDEDQDEADGPLAVPTSEAEADGPLAVPKSEAEADGPLAVPKSEAEGDPASVETETE